MTEQAEATKECVFCAIVAGTAPCAKVFEDATTFAFMDIEPGADGHVLAAHAQALAHGLVAPGEAMSAPLHRSLAPFDSQHG